jgi:hypothetical protein
MQCCYICLLPSDMILSQFHWSSALETYSSKRVLMLVTMSLFAFIQHSSQEVFLQILPMYSLSLILAMHPVHILLDFTILSILVAHINNKVSCHVSSYTVHQIHHSQIQIFSGSFSFWTLVTKCYACYLQKRAWNTLFVTSVVSLYASVLHESWTNTMLTAAYLLLVTFQGKVTLCALSVISL